MRTIKKKLLLASIGSFAALTAVISVSLLGQAGTGSSSPVILGGEPVPPVTPVNTATRDDVTTLRETARAEEFAAMQRAQAELLAKLGRLEAEAEAAARERRESSSPEATEREESYEEQEARMNEQVRAQIELVEATLAAEIVDKDWARESGTELQSAFESEAAQGIRLVEVEFGNSLCRLRLAFDSVEVAEGFRNLPQIVPWSGETFFHAAEIDSGEAVVYIAREGHTLPRADA